MAAIQCACGAVEIELAIARDLFRLQCCCYDCNAALRYAHNRGGPPGPSDHCIDSSWFANDFRIPRGANRIGAFKNFVDADTTRFYCTECWSVLFGDHTVYGGKLIVTQAAAYRDFDGLAGAQRMAPRARHFIKDLTSAQQAVLPAWQGDPSHLYQGVAEILMESFPTMIQAGARGAEVNAQILLAKIGGVFVPTDELYLTAGPPTLMQQMPAEPPE